MQETRFHMGMPITVAVVDAPEDTTILDEVFDYFAYVDETFSPFKETSEVSRFNRGELKPEELSKDMRYILYLAEQTRQETRGFFNISFGGKINPSGVVKGWAIYQAAEILRKNGFQDFFVDAGGDVQVYGNNEKGEPWKVGIRNPFDLKKVVKVVELSDCGIATSGPYIRGAHLYNPHDAEDRLDDILSVTVIGPDVFEADRFATAAFAMGNEGILFIESLLGFDGYIIDRQGRAKFTSGFADYVPQQ